METPVNEVKIMTFLIYMYVSYMDREMALLILHHVRTINLD